MNDSPFEEKKNSGLVGKFQTIILLVLASAMGCLAGYMSGISQQPRCGDCKVMETLSDKLNAAETELWKIKQDSVLLKRSLAEVRFMSSRDSLLKFLMPLIMHHKAGFAMSQDTMEIQIRLGTRQFEKIEQ